jgi:hypothetical protein
MVVHLGNSENTQRDVAAGFSLGYSLVRLVCIGIFRIEKLST